MLPAALIALAGVAVYAGALHGPFVFDDLASLGLNPTIRSLWAWPGPLAPPHMGVTVEGRPILNLSFALNYALGGSDVRGYHAANILIHVLAGLALFGLLRRTLQAVGSARDSDRSSGDSATWQAFAIALLWTLHPLQTEAVTYTVQRGESLMGLFYLLTLYCFTRYASSPAGVSPAGGRRGSTWAVLSFLACLLGMGTKEVMASAPVIVFFYDRAFVSGSFREAWRRRRAYYAALSATWLPLAWEAQEAGSRGGTSGLGSGVGFAGYLLTQFGAIAHYLRLCVWPRPLIFDYGVISAGKAADWAGPMFLVAVLAAGTVWALIRRPRAGFLGLWFFALLAPTSLVPGNRQTWAEHRMYLPLAAVLTALVLTVGEILTRSALSTTGRRRLEGILLLGAALALGALTFGRNRDYRSALALYGDTARKRPENPYAHGELGLALGQDGRTGEAIAQFREALLLKPDYADAHYNLGLALMRTGRTEEGIEEYERAVRIRPDHPHALYNLGLAQAARGRNVEAIACLSQAVRLEPDFADARAGLGKALLAAGRLAEGADQLDRSLELRGDSAAARNALGSVLAQAGLMDRALPEFQAAARLDPASAEIQHNLGNVLAALGRTAEAPAPANLPAKP